MIPGFGASPYACSSTYIQLQFLRYCTFRQIGSHKETLSKYVEIDFAENTTKKAMAIRKSKDLSTLLGNPEDVKLGSFLAWPNP